MMFGSWAEREMEKVLRGHEKKFMYVNREKIV